MDKYINKLTELTKKTNMCNEEQHSRIGLQ